MANVKTHYEIEVTYGVGSVVVAYRDTEAQVKSYIQSEVAPDPDAIDVTWKEVEKF